EPPQYVATLAYANPSAEFDEAMAELRTTIRDATKATTTFGYGPRFQHSTGQLHKGGPPTGLFLQLIHDSGDDVEIPGEPYTFWSEAKESIEKYSRRKPDPKVLEALLKQVRYVTGSFDDDKVYDKIGKDLDEFDKAAGIPFNRLFYLSTAPAFFPVIVEQLGKAGLNKTKAAKVGGVIRRPFATTFEE